MADTANLSAAEIATAVRDGKLSPRDVVDEALARIGKLDGQIGAFQLVRADRARAEADELASRDDLADLPLAGVPIAVKDNVAVAGEPMRIGSMATSAEPQPTDHEVIGRLRAAGAIVVGLTRVPEFCIYAATDSGFGVTRNPWHLGRTAGGSSGGSAAAVAAGMVPLAHGNDGLGSIRIPAACTGLVGIKPGGGVVPSAIGTYSWYGMSENGPLATTVADVAAGLAAMAGRPELAHVKEPDQPLRVAVSVKPPLAGLPVDSHYREVAVATGDLLRAAGHQVTTAEIDYSVRVGAAAFVRWFGGAAEDVAALPDRRSLARRTRTHAALGRAVSRLGLVREKDVTWWRARAAKFFDRFDVLITPTLAQPPIKSDLWAQRSWLANVVSNTRYAPFAAPWNVAGWPAAAVPAGMHPVGVPLSIQLVAPPGGEALLLSVAAQLERLRPWLRIAPVGTGSGQATG